MEQDPAVKAIREFTIMNLRKSDPALADRMQALMEGNPDMTVMELYMAAQAKPADERATDAKVNEAFARAVSV